MSKVYDIEVDKDFGAKLHEMADKANLTIAQMIVDEAFEIILKQCINQAQGGYYELKLDSKEKEYKKLYSYPGEASKFVEGKLTEKLASVGLELLARSDGTFCSPYYIVSFENIKKEDIKHD